MEAMSKALPDRSVEVIVADQDLVDAEIDTHRRRGARPAAIARPRSGERAPPTPALPLPRHMMLLPRQMMEVKPLANPS
jgi:hypothetical protein